MQDVWQSGHAGWSCAHSFQNKSPVLDLLTDLVLLPSVGQGRAGSALLCGKGQTQSAGGAGDQEKACWDAGWQQRQQQARTWGAEYLFYRTPVPTFPRPENSCYISSIGAIWAEATGDDLNQGLSYSETLIFTFCSCANDFAPLFPSFHPHNIIAHL